MEKYLNILVHLLKRATNISAINKQNLSSIRLFISQYVIADRKYKLHQFKKTKTESPDNDIFLRSTDIVKSVDMIIKLWIYNDTPLIKETIVFDDFIDRTLKNFNDLCRLQDQYNSLLSKYSRVLTEQPESLKATRTLITNLELLQVAIGQIHGQLINVRNDIVGSNELETYKKAVSEALHKFPSRSFTFKANDIKYKEMEIHEMDDLSCLSCQHILSSHQKTVNVLKSYTHKGRHYAISLSFEGYLNTWDMDNYTNIATEQAPAISAVTIYEKGNIPMLASGGDPVEIETWDLSKGGFLQDQIDTTNGVSSIDTFYKDRVLYLAAGHYDNAPDTYMDDYFYGCVSIIKVDNGYHILNRLRVLVGSVRSVKSFYQDGKPYLAVGGDLGLSIWCLTTFQKKKRLGRFVLYDSLAILNYNNHQVLACKREGKAIEMWSLDKYDFIGEVNLPSNPTAIEWIEYDLKPCFVAGYKFGYMLVTDFETQKTISAYETQSIVRSICLMKKEGFVHLLSGHEDGMIKVWS